MGCQTSRFASFPAVAEELSYDDAVLVLRGSLVEAAANARVFALRARRGGRLLTARDWAQLAEIEAGLEHDLDLNKMIRRLIVRAECDI